MSRSKQRSAEGISTAASSAEEPKPPARSFGIAIEAENPRDFKGA
jgi:hypothetical protein